MVRDCWTASGTLQSLALLWALGPAATPRVTRGLRVSTSFDATAASQLDQEPSLRRCKARVVLLLAEQLKSKDRTPSLSEYSFKKRQKAYLAKQRQEVELLDKISKVVAKANKLLTGTFCQRFNNWVLGVAFSLGKEAAKQSFSQPLVPSSECIEID